MPTDCQSQRDEEKTGRRGKSLPGGHGAAQQAQRQRDKDQAEAEQGQAETEQGQQESGKDLRHGSKSRRRMRPADSSGRHGFMINTNASLGQRKRGDFAALLGEQWSINHRRQKGLPVADAPETAAV